MADDQISLRTLWTINSLLNGEERSQKEIVEYINNINQKLLEQQIKPVNATNATISHVIKHLKSQKLLEIDSRDVKGTNLKSNYCSVPNSLKNFIKIMIEIEDSKINLKKKNFFINCLINSKIGKTHIKTDIITKLLKINKIQLIKDFEEEEEEFIIKTLKNSPQGLNYTIVSIQNNYPEWQLPDAKDFFLYKLQALLNLDLLEQYPQQKEHQDSKIKFETFLSMNKSKADKELTTNIKHDKSHFLLFLNFYNSISDPEKEIKQYIQTYH